MRTDPNLPMLRTLHTDWVDTVLPSEHGEVFCRCPATEQTHPMAYQNFKAQ